MQYLGKVKVKVKFGGAFDMLCLTGASAIAVNSICKLIECARAKERHNLMKKNLEQGDEALNLIKDITSKIKEHKTDNVDDEDVEDFLK